MINGRPICIPTWSRIIVRSSQSGRSRSKRRTKRQHFYGKRLRRTMTNARILSESWTLAGSSVCSPLSPSAGARSLKLSAKINVGGATTLAKKLRQARTSNYRRVHAREITRLCSLARGCPNFFGQGSTLSNLKGEEWFGEIVDSCVYFLVHDHVLKLNIVLSYSSCVQTVTVVLQQS